MSMRVILSKSRYMIIIPVALTLLASFAAFIWGGVKAFTVIYELISSLGAPHDGGLSSRVELIAVMDSFLIGTALFIFSIGLYELFIEDIDFPEWLHIRDLHSLKTKLGSVIILVMAVTFLEHLSQWGDAWGTLLFAASITLVSGALIAFSYFGGKD